MYPPKLDFKIRAMCRELCSRQTLGQSLIPMKPDNQLRPTYCGSGGQTSRQLGQTTPESLSQSARQSAWNRWPHGRTSNGAAASSLSQDPPVHKVQLPHVWSISNRAVRGVVVVGVGLSTADGSRRPLGLIRGLAWMSSLSHFTSLPSSKRW